MGKIDDLNYDDEFEEEEDLGIDWQEWMLDKLGVDMKAFQKYFNESQKDADDLTVEEYVRFIVVPEKKKELIAELEKECKKRYDEIKSMKMDDIG